MGNLRESSPYAARDAAGFVESMKQLKKLSGLTYRELEEQAARNGEVLARSTLADVLRRTGLPRPEVLAAFVRACGDGERVDAWLEARERIAAAGPQPVPAEPADSLPPEEPAPRRRDRRRLSVIASALALPLLAVGAWGLLPDGLGTDAERTPTDGWVTIRPAGETDLCLTDGRDRAGAYGSAVAVHLPCAQAPVPRTYLEPAGEGRYRVQWHHPEMGKGCLTVMDGGPVKGMIEPRDDCTGATLFRVESAPDGSGFRFRTERHGQCVGTVGRDAAEGVEAVQEPCADTRDQYFVVRED
ncbi:hypothetical protein GCM10010297_45130 [Streptomyces malachitofuscus]|nr:hypothetical protein GCM10010297_45130 [Streptomyces malachitofuscus]